MDVEPVPLAQQDAIPGPPAVAETPSQVMCTWFERVWNERDGTAIDTLLAADAPCHGLGDGMVGPQGFRCFWDAMNASFEGARVEVLDAVHEGEMGYVRCKAWLLAKDGREHHVEGGSLCRVRNGRIVEAWDAWDFLGLMGRMGALPADAFAQACAGRRWEDRPSPPAG